MTSTEGPRASGAQTPEPVWAPATGGRLPLFEGNDQREAAECPPTPPGVRAPTVRDVSWLASGLNGMWLIATGQRYSDVPPALVGGSEGALR